MPSWEELRQNWGFQPETGGFVHSRAGWVSASGLLATLFEGPVGFWVWLSTWRGQGKKTVRSDQVDDPGVLVWS